MNKTPKHSYTNTGKKANFARILTAFCFLLMLLLLVAACGEGSAEGETTAGPDSAGNGETSAGGDSVTTDADGETAENGGSSEVTTDEDGETVEYKANDRLEIIAG